VIKLWSLVSDLLGVSARRRLPAIAEGETDPRSLAQMADPNLRASEDELCNVLQAVTTLDPRYRRVLQQFLDQQDLNERQVQELEEELASALPMRRSRPRAPYLKRATGASRDGTPKSATKPSGPSPTTSAASFGRSYTTP
jgi:hypothetical protein